MYDRYRGHVLPVVLYAYPYEAVTATGQVTTAVLIAAMPHVSFYWMPPGWHQVLFGVALFLSGVLTLVGMFAYRRLWHAGVEQLGLWLGAATMLCYATLIFAQYHEVATFTGMVFLTGAISSALRARAIRILQLRRLEELVTVHELREEVARHGHDHLAE